MNNFPASEWRAPVNHKLYKLVGFGGVLGGFSGDAVAAQAVYLEGMAGGIEAVTLAYIVLETFYLIHPEFDNSPAAVAEEVVVMLKPQGFFIMMAVVDLAHLLHKAAFLEDIECTINRRPADRLG
jgi:hypothetical protein